MGKRFKNIVCFYTLKIIITKLGLAFGLNIENGFYGPWLLCKAVKIIILVSFIIWMLKNVFLGFLGDDGTSHFSGNIHIGWKDSNNHEWLKLGRVDDVITWFYIPETDILLC